MDWTFDEYREHLQGILSTESIRQQILETCPSAKFSKNAAGWQVAPFSGYTVITPLPDEDGENRRLYDQLYGLGQRASARFGLSRVGSLPLSSFHLTVVDIVAGDFYRRLRATEDGVARVFRAVDEAFAASSLGIAPRLRVAGFAATDSAVKAVFSFSSREEYNRLMAVRSSIYQRLGIEHGPYLAHVSLFYKQFEGNEGAALADILSEVNAKTNWSEFPDFVLHTAQLRYFQDMYCFVRDDSWPQLNEKEAYL